MWIVILVFGCHLRKMLENLWMQSRQALDADGVVYKLLTSEIVYLLVW